MAVSKKEIQWLCKETVPLFDYLNYFFKVPQLICLANCSVFLPVKLQFFLIADAPILCSFFIKEFSFLLIRGHL